MNRRIFVQSGMALAFGTPLYAALRQQELDNAADVLSRAVASGQVAAAVLHAAQREATFTRSFGAAKSEQAMFLLGSISKPIGMTALMTLFDRGEFKLDDPLKKFIPRFSGDDRERVTMQHLLTHTSGRKTMPCAGSTRRSSSLPSTRLPRRSILPPARDISIPAWPFCWPRGWPKSSAAPTS
jgi:CubicO group peptidase (beta-lactamase class C family)